MNKNELPSSGNRWKLYLGILKTLNILTIAAPVGLVLTLAGILALRPDLVGIGYLFVILSPVIILALAVGLGVAALNVLIIPVYLLKQRSQLKKQLLGWTVVALSASYFVIGLHFVITRRFPW